MFEAVPFSELREFIKKQRSLGRYKTSTAKNLLAAIGIVEPLLEPGSDSIGYVQDNVTDLFERHRNLTPGVGHSSVIAYRSRLSRALRDYVAHRTGKPARETRSAKGVEKGKERLRKPTETSEKSDPNVARDALLHRFPLRPGFDVQVLLPRDFSSKEARRVTQWISAFAVEEDK